MHSVSTEFGILFQSMAEIERDSYLNNNHSLILIYQSVFLKFQQGQAKKSDCK